MLKRIKNWSFRNCTYVVLATIIAFITILTVIRKKDEFVTISSYNPLWSTWYQEESVAIQKIFAANRIVKIEHFGSTSVPGMWAKPVIDILVGLSDFNLFDSEIEALSRLGYKFIEKSQYCERFYFKKNGKKKFNISFVKFAGKVWNDCIGIRNYLRSHYGKRVEYSNFKKNAISDGYITLNEYSKYKQPIVRKLSQEAARWQNSLRSEVD